MPLYVALSKEDGTKRIFKSFENSLLAGQKCRRYLISNAGFATILLLFVLKIPGHIKKTCGLTQQRLHGELLQGHHNFGTSVGLVPDDSDILFAAVHLLPKDELIFSDSSDNPSQPVPELSWDNKTSASSDSALEQGEKSAEVIYGEEGRQLILFTFSPPFEVLD